MTTRVLQGPIAITGASGQVGTALRRRLRSLPNELRPLGRQDDLAAAFRDAAAVVHLAGSLRPTPPDTFEEANVRTVERTVAALEGSTVERIVFLSCAGADRASDDPCLRAKAEAENLLYGAGRDLVIFRCAPSLDVEDVVDAIVAALDPTSYHGRFDLPSPRAYAAVSG